jgi:hypothetical protein
VRAGLLLAVAALAAGTACGAVAATHPRPIRFGLTGGNVAPYRVLIKPSGAVTIDGPFADSRRKIPAKRVQRLQREIQQAHLAKRRMCPGVLPDIASEYIRLGSHTFTLHGTCEPRFQRVWRDLQHAVGRLRR